MIHELKCWPEYFKHVLDGTKLFELRVDDRNYQVGDTLRQREYEPGGRYVDGNPENGLVTKQGYSGREISQKVTYLLRNDIFLPPNIVAMSLEPNNSPLVATIDAPIKAKRKAKRKAESLWSSKELEEEGQLRLTPEN